MRAIRALIGGATVVCAALAFLAVVAGESQASAAKSHRKIVHRVGGHVHRAWPVRGKAPKGPLARWLAKQVGPFSGFEPFAGANAPNVLWPEGSAEMLLAEATVGQPTSTLTQSLTRLLP